MLPVFLIRFAFGFQFSLRYDEREEGLCIFPADIGEDEVEKMSAQHMKAQYSIAGQALTYGSLLLLIFEADRTPRFVKYAAFEAFLAMNSIQKPSNSPNELMGAP